MCPCVDVVDVASLCTLFVLSLVHFSLSTLLSCRTRLCIHPLTPTHSHVIVLFLAARFALWLYLYLFLFLTFCLFVCVFVCLCSFPPACRSVLWWWWADRVSTPSERALFHGPQMARSRFFHYWWFFLFILGWSINNEQNNNDDPSIQEQSLQTAQEPSVQSVPGNPWYSSLSPQLSRLMKVCVCALFWPPSIIISTQFFFFLFDFLSPRSLRLVASPSPSPSPSFNSALISTSSHFLCSFSHCISKSRRGTRRRRRGQWRDNHLLSTLLFNALTLEKKIKENE